jgi:hypothetical protein
MNLRQQFVNHTSAIVNCSDCHGYWKNGFLPSGSGVRSSATIIDEI